MIDLAARSVKARSYWADTAKPQLAFGALTGDASCHTAIVGAGFTGLAAASSLLDIGVDTVVLEEKEIGWGASGRNGGSATPRYKMGFATLARDLGDQCALALHRELHTGLNAIERNVERYSIDCDFRRCGQITAAHSDQALKELEEDVQWLHTVARDTTPRLLDRRDIRDRLGLDGYVGGYFDVRGAGIHPLNYARGLALGLAKRGLRIFDGTAARAIRETKEGVVIETSTGATLRARALILATDAYTGEALMPSRLHHRFFTMSSSLMTTAPLPEPARSIIMPARPIVADTFALLNYFLMLPDGRLLFGGRGAVTAQEDQAHVYAILERRMRKVFPTLESVPITHRWSGLVGLSEDGYPHAVRLGEAIYCGYGYGGRGVVLSHLLGRLLASMASGRPERLGPITDVVPRPIPLYALKRPLMRMAVRYLALRDRWEAMR